MGTPCRRWSLGRTQRQHRHPQLAPGARRAVLPGRQVGRAAVAKAGKKVAILDEDAKILVNIGIREGLGIGGLATQEPARIGALPAGDQDLGQGPAGYGRRSARFATPDPASFREPGEQDDELAIIAPRR